MGGVTHETLYFLLSILPTPALCLLITAQTNSRELLQSLIHGKPSTLGGAALIVGPRWFAQWASGCEGLRREMAGIDAERFDFRTWFLALGYRQPGTSRAS
jgi:hypothetical protein